MLKQRGFLSIEIILIILVVVGMAAGVGIPAYLAHQHVKEHRVMESDNTLCKDGLMYSVSNTSAPLIHRGEVLKCTPK